MTKPRKPTLATKSHTRQPVETEQDSLVLNVVIAYDTDYSCPWGFGEVMTGQKAQEGLKSFLQEHQLSWPSGSYDPTRTVLEIRHHDEGGDDNHYYGLCPVTGGSSGLLYGHQRANSRWEIWFDDRLVFSR